MTKSRLVSVVHLGGDDFSEAIRWQSKVNPIQPLITFEIQLKIALQRKFTSRSIFNPQKKKPLKLRLLCKPTQGYYFD